jgi:selenocysteine-specific elongation factor
MNHFILATAGHVDHGKSALVKALTGTDPDRLPEEKARGITIELGFAHFILDGPNEQRFHIGIIDVPGHEDFVRNMIAGVGSVDLALLVVAADDGWMPQTEEHFQILSYLGVNRAVIALTKTDLGKIDNVVTQIRAHLRDSAFANSPIISTSTRDNEGIDDLKHLIASELSVMEPPRDIEKPRLFVDRAFALRGIGTVVTGTLSGGTLSRGQSVIVQPQNCPGRIRSIQNHGQDVDLARPGMRTAINLPDTAISARGAGIKRGDVVTIADLGPPGATLGVLLGRSQRLRLNQSAVAARPLKNGATVYVHHGTARVAARIAFLEKDALACGEEAIAQLRLESPTFAFLGDRFVVRDPSERFTIAGGIVLDPNGDRRNFCNSAQLALLAARATAVCDVAGPTSGEQLLQHKDDTSPLSAIRRSRATQPIGSIGGPSGAKWVDLCVQSELAHRGFAQRETLLRKSNFSGDEIAAALLRLQDRKAIVLRGEIAADAEEWHDLFRRASALIDTVHQNHPEQRGLELAELRAQLGDQSADLFGALISDLCANGFVRERSTIGRAAHRAQLPPQTRPAAEKIRTLLAEKPFDPPARKDLTQDRHLQLALRFLIEQGEVVEVSPEIVLLKDASEQMQSAITEFISTHGAATASELRQHLGTSRRVIIPFLEYLDRAGVTHRRNDRRTLRAKAPVHG